MSRQSELFDRAADCARLMNSASDQVKRAMLEQLRDRWVALANDCDLMPARAFDDEIAAMEKIQSSLVDPKAGRLH